MISSTSQREICFRNAFIRVSILAHKGPALRKDARLSRQTGNGNLGAVVYYGQPVAYHTNQSLTKLSDAKTGRLYNARSWHARATQCYIHRERVMHLTHRMRSKRSVRPVAFRR